MGGEGPKRKRQREESQSLGTEPDGASAGQSRILIPMALSFPPPFEL